MNLFNKKKNSNFKNRISGDKLERELFKKNTKKLLEKQFVLFRRTFPKKTWNLQLFRKKFLEESFLEESFLEERLLKSFWGKSL